MELKIAPYVKTSSLHTNFQIEAFAASKTEGTGCLRETSAASDSAKPGSSLQILSQIRISGVGARPCVFRDRVRGDPVSRCIPTSSRAVSAVSSPAR